MTPNGLQASVSWGLCAVFGGSWRGLGKSKKDGLGEASGMACQRW